MNSDSGLKTAFNSKHLKRIQTRITRNPRALTRVPERGRRNWEMVGDKREREWRMEKERARERGEG